MVIIKRCFVFFILWIFLSSGVYAAAGVSPAIYEIDFQPNLKQIFSFNFYTDSKAELDTYAEGDLSEYVKLSTDHLSKSGSVNVLLELPEEIEKPGLHTISIGGRQIVNVEKGVGTSIDIRAFIRIRVPYPGQYAELDFSASDTNEGEPVDFKLKIYSRGDEDISTESRIDIYNIQDKKTETIKLGTNLVASKESVDISKSWDTIGKFPGRYRAVAVTQYGGNEATAEDNFRIGELYVNITDYTKEFDREKINKFDINVESFWNDPIENVFANVSMINHSISFLTPSTNINNFGKATLTGYFDTTSIEEEKFQAKVIVYYEGKTTEKMVNLRFKREINYPLIVGISIILLIIVLLVIFTIRKENKR